MPVAPVERALAVAIFHAVLAVIYLLPRRLLNRGAVGFPSGNARKSRAGSDTSWQTSAPQADLLVALHARGSFIKLFVCGLDVVARIEAVAATAAYMYDLRRRARMCIVLGYLRHQAQVGFDECATSCVVEGAALIVGADENDDRIGRPRRVVPFLEARRCVRLRVVGPEGEIIYFREFLL